MEAKKLYDQLEKDFIFKGLSDDWAQYMMPIEKFLTENYKKRSMGLVCDFTDQVDHVYTAVFPSNKVMGDILAQGKENAMLLVHHPSTWDIRRTPDVFQLMDTGLLEKFRERKISIYNLHTPLDNYGEYSTSVTFAHALGLTIEKPFVKYFGSLAGVITGTKEKTVHDLQKKFQLAVGHKVSLYQYGDESIKDGKVAVIAGGGNDISLIPEIVAENIHTFVTGITAKSEYSRKAHEFLEAHKINLLGGTHYSTEKFACMAICAYFEKMKISSEYIEDVPVLEDL